MRGWWGRSLCGDVCEGRIDEGCEGRMSALEKGRNSAGREKREGLGNEDVINYPKSTTLIPRNS